MGNWSTPVQILTGSTHYLLCSWVPRGRFNQPQDHVLCLQSWVGRISGYGGPNMGLEPWWIFIFTVRPRNKIHRYQETSLISFLKPTKRGTSRKKVTFQKKKSILCDLKKKCWGILGGIVIYLYPTALRVFILTYHSFYLGRKTIEAVMSWTVVVDKDQGP